jgi:hypothetical protein
MQLPEHATATSWIVATTSVIGAGIALFSRAALDPLMAVIVSGGIIILLSIEVIFGYIFNVPEMYELPNGKAMSLLTAVVFLIIGLGKITMATYLRKVHKILKNRVGLLEEDTDNGEGSQPRRARLLRRKQNVAHGATDEQE